MSYSDAIRSFEAIRQKPDKRCVLDSALDWGKFDISLDFDEESGAISGKLKINQTRMASGCSVDDRFTCRLVFTITRKG